MKMTLSSPSPNASERQVNTDRSNSPSSSPRGSPRPSPRPQSKKDHSKSEHLSGSYKEHSREHSSQQSLKHEGSPSSQECCSVGSSGKVTNIEVTPPQPDLKFEVSRSSSREKGSRGKKKSSWFNFYPTYKSRSEDFKRLFKEVPDDERLVVDYSCALQKEILVQGRLYVTQNYLCFYANIFGWETNLTVKWKEVAAITKEKTALVIPNAVLICTNSDNYFFTTFAARDKTYLMLFRVWQNALMDQPMTAQEMWQWVHQCYGAELGLTSDDEDYISPNIPEEDKLSARLSIESFSESEAVAADMVGEQLNMEDKQEDDPMKLSVTSVTRSITEPQLSTDQTDNSESDVDRPITMKTRSHEQLSPLCLKVPIISTPDNDDSASVGESGMCDSDVKCTSTHEGKVLLTEVLPIHIDQLFTLLFTSSKFYLDFHASRKTQDLTQTPWTHNPVDNCKSRVVNLTMALSQTLGPKSSNVTETQIMLPCSKAGNLYAIDVESTNAGIPYADSFVVLVHYCLQKVSDTHSSIGVYAQIKYKKNVFSFVKGMIERNCYAGLDEFFQKLKESLFIESEENIPELKRKSRRKRRLLNLPKCNSEDPRISVPRKKIFQTNSIFNSDVCTIIVFVVLTLLLILNVMLYYKLWSLEEAPYSLLDLHVMKSPPKSHDEWIRLLQQQEALHTIEAHKWQKILKTSIKLLRQTEESLNELQHSIHPTYMTKVMAAMENEEQGESPKEL